ncbi:MAG: KpsF/GutQ family sugar-phosphate isomerase [Paracoccaceae bacterium]
MQNSVPTPDDAALAATIRSVLHKEAAAIASFAAQPENCARAVRVIAESTGPLIVAGIGKSGHIAGKLASTFRSLGRLAMYLHPSEASHGDLSLVQSASPVLVISHSGETSELSDLLVFCRQNQVDIISITSRTTSTLARASRVAICYGVVEEACPNGLAPTTSTTLALAIGDALAVGVSVVMGALPEDFRRYHPGGRLGVRLLVVADLMRSGAALPLVAPDARMSDVVVEMSAKSLGLAILAEQGRVLGVITDGDLRRNADRLWEVEPMQIASPRPVQIPPDALASDAAELMTARGVSVCLVMSGGALHGVLHMHDCLRAGVGV